MKARKLSDGDIFIYNGMRHICFGVIQDNKMLCKNLDTEQLCAIPVKTEVKLER